MLDGCEEAIVAVWSRSVRWRSLRWAIEARRAFSGGERIEGLEAWEVVRRGEGWPERERRISWSILGRWRCRCWIGGMC